MDFNFDGFGLKLEISKIYVQHKDFSNSTFLKTDTLDFYSSLDETDLSTNLNNDSIINCNIDEENKYKENKNEENKDEENKTNLLLLNKSIKKKGYYFKKISQTKKNNMGRRKQNENYNNKPKKSWDHPMNIWKCIRVRINKYLFKKLNMLSKKYSFSEFHKFDGKISTKKEDNELLLNGTIKNYIIKSGISGNYNKKRKINENKNIDNLNNSDLIEKILKYETTEDNKPFTNFINMEFKYFYFEIFLKNNDNNNLNENLKNFNQYIKDFDEEKKRKYKEIAENIYTIYENKIKKNLKIKFL